SSLCHCCTCLILCYYSPTIILFAFFFNDTATTEIYTLSLHDALPISPGAGGAVTAARLRASIMMPNGPPLGAHDHHRAPHATGLSLDNALGSNRTDPTDPGSDGEPTTLVFTKELSCSGMRSLTDRA